MSSPSDAIQLREAVADLARRDFGVFAMRAFEVLEGHPLDYNWHFSAITALAMQIESGEVRRAVVCMPPRYLKSFILTVAFPAWCLGRDPRARIICCSYGIDLAEKFSNDTLRLMRTDWYRRVFPNSHISPSKATKSEFHTTAEGYRFASSVGGTLTGRGADLIIIDDPLKAGDAHSEAFREASITWFNSSVRTRLDNPKTGKIVVVAQRLHANDLPGLLLESNSWIPLIIPAIQWQNTSYKVGAGLRPAFSMAGRVLQTTRQDLADLEELRREMGERDFEAQYNQRPLPPGGAIFKAEWFQRYDAPPPPEKVMAIVQSWDTAFEINADNDYSVCTTWAVCGDGFHLLDVWRDRPAFFDLEKMVYQLRDKWRANVAIIERAGSGISLLQNLRNRDRQMWLLDIKPAGAKISRAEQQTPKFEQRKIWLPRQATWLVAYEKELLTFPQAKHDDQVDSTVQFLAAYDTGNLMRSVKNFGQL